MTQESREMESVEGSEGGSPWVEIVEVLYSPLKAFRKIVAKPQLKGPILIFVIAMILTTIGQYLQASKLLLQTDAGGTVPLTAANGFASFLGGILATSASTFFLHWIIYTVILLLIIKLFGTNTKSWSAFFTIIGYVFSALIVYLIINVILISSLPPVTLPLKTLPTTTEEATAADAVIRQVWGGILAYQAGPYISYAFNVWIAALSAVAIHISHKLTWGKALTIAAIAAIINFILILLIG